MNPHDYKRFLSTQILHGHESAGTCTCCEFLDILMLSYRWRRVYRKLMTQTVWSHAACKVSMDSHIWDLNCDNFFYSKYWDRLMKNGAVVKRLRDWEQQRKTRGQNERQEWKLEVILEGCVHTTPQLSLLRRDTNLVQFSDSLVIKEENNNHFLSLE